MGDSIKKTKFSIRVDNNLLKAADSYIEGSNVQSRTELIEYALRFYLGFLTAENAEDYMLDSVSSMMTGMMHDTENRLARMDFKIAVELSKLSQVIAYSHDIDEEALNRLHLKCVEEVKRINGAVDFESAYSYRKHEI